MNTQEYLWWIETIRQDEFRKLLPSNIVGWVSLTISLIALFIFIICFSIGSLNGNDVLAVSLLVCLISFLIGTSSLMLGEIISKRSRKHIEEVKKIWKNKTNEKIVHYEGLKWFYTE